MHSRSTTIIGAGVAVALLGAILVFVYARNLQGTAGATGAPTYAAYVATTPITAGTSASAINAAVKQSSVPASARPADTVTQLSQLTGLVTLRKIEPGEVITTSQFGTAGTPSTDTSGLSIPAGFNAITVNVPIPQNVAGYVSPGDKVNVYMMSHDIGGANAAWLLLSGVTVLATVPEGTPAVANPAPATGAEYLTLALTPPDSEKLVFAEAFEQVWFGLVHPGDGPAPQSQPPATLFK
jgi:Flp pilus assembly protein CpaB